MSSPRRLLNESTSDLVHVSDMLGKLDAFVVSFDVSGLTKSKKTILQSFLRLATAHGYSAVTMRTLASAAGVKPPTIYSHFPGGRDEIVSAALRWHHHDFSSAVREGLQGCSSPDQFWHALIRVHIVQQITQPENDLWDMLVATDRLGGFLHPDLRKEVDSWLRFCDYLYESILLDSGHVDACRKARLLRVCFDGAGNWWSWDGTAANLEECVAYATKIAEGIIRS